MNRRILVLKIFLVAVLLSLGADHTGRSHENKVGAKWQTTDWGQMFRGLQMRVNTATSVVSEEMLELNLEFRITPDSLESQIKDIVLLPPAATATLDVYDQVTGKQTRHVWKPDNQPSFTSVRFDAAGRGDSASLGIRIETPTPLVIVESQARCRLDLFVPMLDSSAWSGIVSSPLFDLTLIPKHAEIETLTVIFPRECKLFPGPRLGFDSLNMDSVKVEHHKGLCFSGTYSPDETVPAARHFSLPGRLIFENGQMNISNRFDIYESPVCPQHRWELEGQVYRVLWEKEYPFTLHKDEVDSMTIPEREQFSYRTYLMPRQVRVTGKGEVVTDESNPVPIECKIRRGYEVGYWVTINGEHSKPIYHAPRSPLYHLPHPPTCESPVKFEINLFQFRWDFVGTDKMDDPPRISRLWAGHARLSDTTTSVNMERSEDMRLPRQILWRQCRMPRRLEIDSSWQLIADMLDPIILDFSQMEDRFPLVKLTVGTENMGYLPTFLPDVLCWLDSSVSRDSVLKVTLSMAEVQDSCPPPEKRVYTFWSKEYQLEIPHVQRDSTEGGRQHEH